MWTEQDAARLAELREVGVRPGKNIEMDDLLRRYRKYFDSEKCAAMRDDFARTALAGLLEANDVEADPAYLAMVARTAYAVADAMLREREK